jgi:hypothetical protein
MGEYRALLELSEGSRGECGGAVESPAAAAAAATAALRVSAIAATCARQRSVPAAMARKLC